MSVFPPFKLPHTRWSPLPILRPSPAFPHNPPQSMFEAQHHTERKIRFSAIGKTCHFSTTRPPHTFNVPSVLGFFWKPGGIGIKLPHFFQTAKRRQIFWQGSGRHVAKILSILSTLSTLRNFMSWMSDCFNLQSLKPDPPGLFLRSFSKDGAGRTPVLEKKSDPPPPGGDAQKSCQLSPVVPLRSEGWVPAPNPMTQRELEATAAQIVPWLNKTTQSHSIRLNKTTQSHESSMPADLQSHNQTCLLHAIFSCS